MTKEKYISSEGKEYGSYEDYCNSMDLDPDIIGVMLATNRRTPQNEYEKKLLIEIEEKKKKNIGVEFPFN